MITTQKAKIIDRTFFCSVECPHCEEEIMFDMNYDLGSEYVVVQCEVCGEQSKVSVFEYFSQYN